MGALLRQALRARPAAPARRLGRGAQPARARGDRLSPQATAEIALVRHAESSWSAAGRWQGQGDPPLSPRGRAQAAALAAELAGQRFELVVASDLARALETARPLARALGLEPLRCRGLRELDLGGWTGLTRAEIAARDPEGLAGFEAGGPQARAGGGETRDELARRARASLRALASRHPGLRIAVVTHLGVIRAILGEEVPHAAWRWLGT